MAQKKNKSEKTEEVKKTTTTSKKKETSKKASVKTSKVTEKKEVKETSKKGKKTSVKASKEVKGKTSKKGVEAKKEEPKKKEATSKKATKETTSKKETKAKKGEVKETPTIVVKEPKKGSLAEMIINAAKNKYPYIAKNGMTIIDATTRKKLTEEEYNKLALHRDICKELVRLSTEFDNFPYSVLVYFAVGTDAHRPIAFNKGYKTINIPKAETILKWLKWFAEYNKNPKFYACDKIVHAFAKFYNEYSKKDKDFKTIMKRWVKMPAEDGFKTTQFKTMFDFYKLFTKPIILTCEEDEKTKEERIVSITPNPLLVEETKHELVPMSHYMAV